MPWVRFSDDWYDDDKLAGADAAVLAMWCVGITWCARHLTDGFIPHGEHRTLVNLYGTFDASGQSVHPDNVAAELVDRGAWQSVAKGFQVVNYDRYQPSREKVLADRAAEAERKRRVRADSAPDGGPDSEPESRQSRVPSPEGSSQVSPSVLPVGTCPQADDVPEAVWAEYARLKRLRGTQKVQNIARYDAKTARNARVECGEQAARWLEMFDVTPSELALGLVEGKASPHWTRRRAAS